MCGFRCAGLSLYMYNLNSVAAKVLLHLEICKMKTKLQCVVCEYWKMKGMQTVHLVAVHGFVSDMYD